MDPLAVGASAAASPRNVPATPFVPTGAPDGADLTSPMLNSFSSSRPGDEARRFAQRRCAEISVGQFTLHPAWRSAPNQAIAEMSAITKTINLANVSLFISRCGLSAKSRDHHCTAGRAKTTVSPRHFDRSRSVPPRPKDASRGRGLGWASLSSVGQGALRL